TEQLDILTVVDRSGRVIYRAGNPSEYGDRLESDPLVFRALAGEVAAGSQVFSPERLVREGGQIARQAVINVIPTERAKPEQKKSERSGMMMVASAPIRNGRGDVVGALYGGVLLNGNNAVVDRIKKIVFEGVQFEGKDVGTATIFLDDIRITTNVQTLDNKRAIGTRLSAEVYNRVNQKREKWVGRAFVVNDWYYTAYEPILDLDNAVIGSLYVGMREQPNTALKKKIGLLFAGVLLAGSIFGLAVSGFIGSRLSRPIRELQRVVRRFSAGEQDLRIETTSRDEIGDLAQEFKAMTVTLMQREAAINVLNRDLELKVQERTAELETKNLLLMKTQSELVRAEKLAAVGELAAGVAHEINNPMAIIRGNAEVLLMELEPEHPSREEAEIISRQVTRVKGIVGSLLSFARQQPKNVKRVAICPILEEILRQVKHHVSLEGIEVKWEPPADEITLEADEDQLRQVFTNLIINAVQAMGKGGTLTISTSLERGSCRVEIGDTGIGISQEKVKDVFTPFYTTKQSGTGLGLSVSYGIVKDHGGTISVRSEPGAGAVFVVTLPQVKPGS
ncbi:MAG TPA: cache domain-containing protein, partial [Geobacteraceae bacterium]|nr:cache domain-containing protein [Geobacteraceae bacterium]